MTDEDDVWDEMEAEEPELEFDYSGTELAGTGLFLLSLLFFKSFVYTLSL